MEQIAKMAHYKPIALAQRNKAITSLLFLTQATSSITRLECFRIIVTRALFAG